MIFSLLIFFNNCKQIYIPIYIYNWIIKLKNSLRDIDIEFLGRLCTRVNIIPVISKADGLTREEQQIQKQLVCFIINNIIYIIISYK